MRSGKQSRRFGFHQPTMRDAPAPVLARNHEKQRKRTKRCGVAFSKKPTNLARMKTRGTLHGQLSAFTQVDIHASETLRSMARLFERVPDIVFFAKDRAGRYLAASPSLVERCGLPNAEALLGKHVRELFPAELAARYAAQDEAVLRTGRPLVERLELGWYPGRRAGWCITSKQPLRDAGGQVVGLVGLSRDLHAPVAQGIIPGSLADALEYLEHHYAEPITPSTLAARAGLTPVRLTQFVKRIFGHTPRDLITQTRLAAASRLLLETTLPVAVIALDCGFYDHSALTTAFREATGTTPTQYREQGRV